MYKRVFLERNVTFVSPRIGKDLFSTNSQKARDSKSAPTFKGFLFSPENGQYNHSDLSNLTKTSDDSTTVSADVDSHLGVPRVRTHLTPAGLCEILRQRGLGDPRSVPNASSRSKRGPSASSLLCMHRYKKLMEKRPRYYMEKLKGKARIDLDVANAKAQTFCEEVTALNRKYHISTLFRQQKKDNFSGSSQRASTQCNREQDAAELLDDEEQGVPPEDLSGRILIWMEDCKRAWETHHGKRGLQLFPSITQRY